MLETPNAPAKSMTLAGATAGLPKEVASHGFLQELARERTFENLSASLGEDKAKGVITSIGMAALNAAPELNGAGLGAVVAQTLARLTQQELAGISRNESSAVGRVQSIVQEEVKAQKNAQAPVNLHGAAQAHAQGDLRGIGAALGAFGRESSARFDGMKAGSDASDAAKQAGVSASDLSSLSKLYGAEAVNLAMRQITDMGLRGRENVALAAENPEVAAYLQTGDVAAANAAADQIKDPKKKARAKKLIKNYEEAHKKDLLKMQNGEWDTKKNTITSSAAIEEKAKVVADQASAEKTESGLGSRFARFKSTKKEATAEDSQAAIKTGEATPIQSQTAQPGAARPEDSKSETKAAEATTPAKPEDKKKVAGAKLALNAG